MRRSLIVALVLITGLLAGGTLAAAASHDTTNNTSNAVNQTNETNVTTPTEDEEAVEENVSVDMDTVIITSTTNYPDAIIASTASEKLGLPLLLTDNNTISNETEQALTQLDPENVVVVGGPAVVSPDIEQQLTTEYDVTRLWGLTQYGTAAEVAEYFWPEGADEAVLVQNDRNQTEHRSLLKSSQLARQDGTPLYLAPSDQVSALTISSMRTLGVENATVIGTNITADTQDALEEANISIASSVAEPNHTALQTALDEQVQVDLSGEQQVIVTASEDYRTAIAALQVPDTSVAHVSSQNDSATFIQQLNESDVENVTVVGEGELVTGLTQQVEDMNRSVQQVEGSPAAIAAEINLQHAETFAEVQEQRISRLSQSVGESDSARLRTLIIVSEAEELVEEDAPQQVQQRLQQAVTAFENGDYLEARTLATQAAGTVRLQRYAEVRGTAQLEQEVERELQSISTFRREISRINQRFAAQFEQQPFQDQLIIYESLRTESQDQAELVINETVRTENASTQEEFVERFERARERVEAGNVTANQTNVTTNATGNVTVNETNMTTNQTNVTVNQTNATANETNRTENESGTVTPISGERFDYETRCMTASGATNNVSIRSGAVHNVIVVEGNVVLPTPNFNATSNVSVNEDQQQVDVDVNFTEREGIGIQCVGEGTFTQEVNVSDGNWTVDAAVTVDNESLANATETVQVPAQPSEDTNETNTTGENDSEGTATGERQEISMVDNAFQPENITVEQGDTLVFVNDGDNSHTVTVPGLDVDQEVAPGESVTVEADEAGTYELVCRFHEPVMTGTITVEESEQPMGVNTSTV